MDAMVDLERTLLSRARSVAGIIEAEAVTVEKEATVTRPIHDALVEKELYWIALPKDLGGSQADIATCIKVIEEISRADGSTGWAYFVNVVTTAGLVACLSDKGVSHVFSGKERPIIAGQFTPVGRAVATAGGYICNGKHAYASGSTFANWIGCGQILYENGAPLLDANGAPRQTISLMPRSDVVFTGNWDVMGLAGTGSYDYEVTECFVPDYLVTDGGVLAPDAGPKALRGHATLRFGILGLGLAGHTACLLGIAKRALQEITALVLQKTRIGYTGLVADDPVFLNQFASMEAEYHAARGLFLDTFREAEGKIENGTFAKEDMDRLRQVSTWTHGKAGEVIAFSFRWGGTTPVRNPHVLGRCMRDGLVGNSHLLFDPKSLTDAAPSILRRWSR